MLLLKPALHHPQLLKTASQKCTESSNDQVQFTVTHFQHLALASTMESHPLGGRRALLKKSKQRKNKKIFSDLHLKCTAQSFEATFILFLCSQLGTPFHKANCSMAAKQGDRGLCRQDFDQQMCHHWEKLTKNENTKMPLFILVWRSEPLISKFQQKNNTSSVSSWKSLLSVPHGRTMQSMGWLYPEWFLFFCAFGLQLWQIVLFVMFKADVSSVDFKQANTHSHRWGEAQRQTIF